MTTEKISERQFQKMVLLLFKTYGWQTAHFDASVRVVGKERRFVGDRGAAGFPDIVAIRAGRLIFAELKASKGSVRKNQQEWLDALDLSPAEVYVWRPEDLQEIQRIISRTSS